MQKVTEFLTTLDKLIGGSSWFVYLLLGTGIFFTLYLYFPQIRYFKYALKIVRGKFDREGDEGDTSHFQALTTALSGTVGTGNIAGVALALHLGGPAALFWMLITALIGMTTKFVEVTLSHKYREKASDGSISGGPMYFMKKRLNITLPSGKSIKTGSILAVIFAIATIFSSFGTGNLPQVNSIANSLFQSFQIPHIFTGIILSIFLAFIIIGGIKRIARVTEKLVPIMAVIYLIGALLVIIYNYENIIPSLKAIASSLFNGSAATGGFLGATMAFAFNRGVNRGLFSNEAGQGSAPIAHAAARAHEPVSEGLVALLEPFIDTVIICMITGLTILSSGVWKEKHETQFQMTDTEILAGYYNEKKDQELLSAHIKREALLPLYSGTLRVENGLLPENITVIHARSVAEDVLIKTHDHSRFSGNLKIKDGKLVNPDKVILQGKSLIHSAPLTALAFSKSWLGKYGQYIVSLGLLLFAFSTSIAWSYYGGRAVTFLFGIKGVIWYKLIYIIGFFLASFTDTTIIWIFSGITIALMTIPNLIGLLCLHREVKAEIGKFWDEYRKRFPDEKAPKR
ncbi:alanine/glycine:cation symporter family protein [Thermophagus xiamenensis]|uniref:Alanine or glycine:cation symporter, AGCS family n=1 Tax=Thermophagus xiamenensis TaxID=385682 RepID=A0A1I1Y6N3_9BACT|nr:sodium:alanine symporter family protein [Thermophagus xiamenensis]SFE13803.1 alanine or glycine:cation symporter, AGCS family [Thermophagus xiamenensis]